MVFKVIFYPADGEKSIGPTASIAVDEQMIDRHGTNVLTAEAANAIGFAGLADRLIKELEDLKHEAEAKFKSTPEVAAGDRKEPPPKPFDLATQSE
jgi:hypothetical protein